MDAFDYIIIGAGSAGAVLASKLTENPATHVLVIEAGGSPETVLMTMPKGFSKNLRKPDHMWHFQVKQPAGSDRPDEVWVRGRTLGGSSSVNGMVYTRCQPEDYDEWNDRAGPGWGWSDMKRAFMAIEDHELGATSSRGAGGPLHVAPTKFRYPLTEKLLDAGVQMGVPRKDDINGEDQEGVGYYNYKIRNGRRVSAYTAFLKPAMSRPNLTVSTQTYVDRIIFEGARAVGVAARRNGEAVTFRSKSEIILAAGAIMSPKILQLSGIGPGEHLRKFGIDVRVDSPDVGGRMREHLGFTIPYRLKNDPGINNQLFGIGLVKSVLRYYLNRSGVLATGPYEVGGFVRTLPESTRPDTQIYLGGFATPRNDKGLPSGNSVEHLPGVSISGHLLQNTSEGTVMIASADPQVAPVITPNWLDTERDRRAAVVLVRYLRKWMAMPALAPFIDHEISPGTKVQSDEEILATFKRLSYCGLHATSTCRMGNDNRAVLDNQLRVRGVEGLRVVDCSAMPNLVTGNTSAPAMAMGWRAAEVIRNQAA